MIVYTDGACKGNPGVGGCAAVLIDDGAITILSGGEAYTTNMRMEVLAVIKGLSYLADVLDYKDPVTLYTDSQYVERAINEGWLSKWLDNSFDKVKNKDLWIRVWKYVCMLDVKFVWVRGHDDVEYNVLADKFAQQACYFQGIPFKYKNNKALF